MYRIAFMQRALWLARKGTGRVSPNPLVGCVIARQDRIIAEGWHDAFGGPHGEAAAVSAAREDLSGADVYVTLEPCAHHGKTPPCADLLIENRVRRVFVGMTDPNPAVNGNGIRKLREAGIEVVTGCLEAQCRELNRFFIHHVTTGRPYVILKAALTLDGFIADESGDSKWISSADSRKTVHATRAAVDAVLVGAGTVRADNPKLTVRDVPGRDPVAIILTRSGNIPNDCHLQKPGTLLVTPPGVLPADTVSAWSGTGGKVLETDTEDLDTLLKTFGTMGIASLLVEGGAGIFGAFVEQGLVNEYQLYSAPVILGAGISWAGLTRNRTMAKAIRLDGRDTFICLRES